MAHTKTKAQAAPAESGPTPFPTSPFHKFQWTPASLPSDTKVSVRELCQLVEHVKDVASGAALVIELMASYQEEVDSDETPYLNPFHLGLLQRLAMRSLDSLDDTAYEIANGLHQLAKGEA